jgi:hypothetical protein
MNDKTTAKIVPFDKLTLDGTSRLTCTNQVFY